MAFNIPGLNFVKGIDVGGILSKGVNAIQIFLMILAIAGVIGYMLYRKKYNAQFTEKIYIFEEIKHKFVPNTKKNDTAMLFNIPGTNVQILSLRKSGIYLPKGSRKMGESSYWYGINKFGDFVNFDLESLNDSFTTAKLGFNTEGAKLLYVHMNKMLQEEYKNKSLKWWVAYKEIITLVITVFLVIGSVVVVFNKVNKLVDSVAGFEAKMAEDRKVHQELDIQITENMNQLKRGSGVITTGGG